VVYQCILDVAFHVPCDTQGRGIPCDPGGPPTPPLELEVDGAHLRDVRLDERTWEDILRKSPVRQGASRYSGTEEKPSAACNGKSNIFVLEESERA